MDENGLLYENKYLTLNYSQSHDKNKENKTR